MQDLQVLLGTWHPRNLRYSESWNPAGQCKCMIQTELRKNHVRLGYVYIRGLVEDVPWTLQEIQAFEQSEHTKKYNILS